MVIEALPEQQIWWWPKTQYCTILYMIIAKFLLQKSTNMVFIFSCSVVSAPLVGQKESPLMHILEIEAAAVIFY